MKATRLRLVLILMQLLFLGRNEVSAQITIDNAPTISQLVNGILIPTGSGTVVSNVTFQGVRLSAAQSQASKFTTATTTLAQMGFSSGVALYSGYTTSIPLPLANNPGNTQSSSGGLSSTVGEIRSTGTSPVIINDLQVLVGAGNNYLNSAILEFDFIPVDTRVQFRYIFGSEEYNDSSNPPLDTNYNCSSYNDKFGFLISGPGIAGGQGYTNNAKNIARLANGSEVSINSVNDGVVGGSAPGQNASYCTAANSSWVQNTPTPEFLGLINGTQSNGNTRILTASQTGLIPGQTYHIKLIITDVKDTGYDSVVYLEAGSFTTELSCNAGPDQTLCNVTTTTLAATLPVTGTWSVTSGSATFANANSPTSGVTGLSLGTNVLRWTATDLSCFDEMTITVNSPITPTFTAVAPICSGGSLSALPTTSNNGINGTWSPALNNTATTVYTFAPSVGQCATTTTLTITVNPNVTPTFNPVTPICSGGSLSALPTTSTNGINGTWSPALNNTTTTIYTFTPTAGQCATTTTLTITVNPNVTPTFNSVASICSGGSLSALPTTSTNGITGTWSPALNNTTTTIYTFTPTVGQCATNTTLTITVNPNVTPMFAAVTPICSGGSLSALPITSTNGINGTWSPALNNTTTTIYTFTPTAGQCATTTTLTIMVNPNVTPAFTAVASICSGGSLSALLTTSTNGITGTWSPALNNTTTTIYTFTPTAGQCATTTTLTITVNPNVTPAFNAVTPICSGATLSALPTTSTNGINGAWSPALNNTTTTLYTFTPTAGQCATTTTLTITVNPTPVLVVSCGATTPSSVTFNWNSIADATSYNYSYSINGGPAVTGTLSSSTTTFTVNALSAGQSVSITITPVGSVCAQPASANCVSSNCPSPIVNAIANSTVCAGGSISAINFTSPTAGVTFTWSNNNTSIGLGANGTGFIPAFTAVNVLSQQIATITVTANDGSCTGPATIFTITINPNVMPTFTAVPAICLGGSLSALPTTSNNGINGIWSPALNNTTTIIYTFTPTAGQCATTTTLTITVNPNVTPTFNTVTPICSGATLSALPTTSTNGITGTWSPALNNTATTLYTFTPTAGQCAINTTLTITVNPNVTPTFTAVPAICSGGSLVALPTTSNNGINGTWSPALNNTATTVYTFTPTAGQCATNTTLTITINPNVTPTFTAVPAICSGGSLSVLPTTSTNGINGMWSPALNNIATTVYTFTPTAGQCATTTTLTITVNPNVTPTFAAVASICLGGSLTSLPTISTNGISGTWSPVLDNITTTIYTFTPTGGQCATTTTLTITVNPNITPTFNAVTPICSGGSLSALPMTSTNGINGTWSPALNNTTTTLYTFTPTTGQCATTTTLTITVNSPTIPTFTTVSPICSGGSLSALPTTSTNGINGTWSPALNNTASTTYMFTPTAGQCAATTTLIITVNPIPEVTLTHRCNGTNFELMANSLITNGLSYEWYNSNNPTVVIGNASTIFISNVGSYFVIVKNGNCEGQAFYDAANLYCGIPKGISPNGDGLNDTFDLSNLNAKRVQIFNRYGMEMYNKWNYKNEWDGKTNSGLVLPDATYYYVIEFNNNEIKTGWVYKNSEYK